MSGPIVSGDLVGLAVGICLSLVDGENRGWLVQAILGLTRDPKKCSVVFMHRSAASTACMQLPHETLQVH